jgi:leucyl aminopeptidase
MKILVENKLSKVDACFVFVGKTFSAKNYNLPNQIEKEILTRKRGKDFEGKNGEILPIFTNIKNIKKVFLVGAGDEKKEKEMRLSAGVAIRKAKKIKAEKIAFYIPKNWDIKRVISGAVLGNYEFKIGDKKDFFDPQSLTILSEKKVDKKDLISETEIAEATNFVRNLINLPANFVQPKTLSAEAKKISKGVTNPVKVKILGEKEMAKQGMGALMGVGHGSHEESQLIVFEYYGGKKNEAPIALVGKGVCFDAGGYNLKPTNYIEEMKSDMAGAATVLGMFKWIAKVKPKKNIVGVVGAVENLVSGGAFKPGDILTAMNGKTIEITNTDAEGRLVLADALYYTATKLNPEKMIDLATLTGAVVAALGNDISAIMGNDPKLISEIKASSQKADEPTWELPLTEEFGKNMEGDISDLRNTSKVPGGGSCTAGAFLQNFIDDKKWVHIDIAGTAFNNKASDAITQKGATGVMMRTLKNLLE